MAPSTCSLTILCLLAAGGVRTQAQTIGGDSARGALLLRELGCIRCHMTDGEGGGRAPDLGRRISRNYATGPLAGVLWNHAGSRWFGQAAQPSLSEGQAADLLAYFTSRRYFEPPGDARRGKLVFAAQGCAGCHGISASVLADASPVAAWDSIRDPIAFALAMWNCPRLMSRAFERHGIRCPRLTAQAVNDLLVYLENLPATRGRQPRFHLISAETGRALFHAKGCAGCHGRRLPLENRPSRFSMAAVSAAMWNHALAAGTTPLLNYEDMCAIVSYLWSIDAHGNSRRGQRLFRGRCLGCHETTKPAVLATGTREAVPVSIFAALWNHGPSMRASLARKGLPWPRFRGAELTDLNFYLNSPGPFPFAEVQGGAVGIGLLRTDDRR